MYLTCKICNESFNSNAFGMHLKHKHNISSEAYYKTYINACDGICRCGKPKHFLGVLRGYKSYCSTKCARNDPEQIKRREETCLKKYGVKCSFAAPSVMEKRFTTCEEKYGNKFPQKTDSVKEKQKQSCIDKWGVESYTMTEDFKEKAKNTCIKKTDGKCTWSSQYPSTIEKRVKSFKEKHAEWLLHFQKTCLEKYGVENPMQVSEIRKKTQNKYIYDMKYFDSAAEIAYYIWLKDHDIKFTYQPHVEFSYTFDGKEHFYEPDFKVGEEYIEIKGSHFFENGKMINPFDRSQDALYEAKHQCMIANNVKIITDYSEYTNYVSSKYGKDYIKKFNMAFINQIYETLGDFPYIDDTSSKDNIVKTYHKSIWGAKVKNHISPIEAWNDEKLVKRLISNRLMYDTLPITPNKVRNAMNVTKLAPKVSVFKYDIAKRLVETYLSEYDTVFDPFSGFSGRMLATCDCGKKYIGQDINQTHVKESNEIIRDYSLDASVYECNIFHSSFNYDCLFTCPPYNLKEQWNKNETDMSCDEWIDECLKRFKCKRYVFVVDNTEKYKDKIVETLKNKSHFGTNQEYVLVF